MFRVLHLDHADRLELLSEKFLCPGPNGCKLSILPYFQARVHVEWGSQTVREEARYKVRDQIGFSRQK